MARFPASKMKTAILAVIFVQVIFGASPVVMKFCAEKDTSPTVFTCYRDILSTPVMLLAAYLFEGKILRPDPRMCLLFLVMGGLGIGGNQLLYIIGLYHAGPNLASTIEPIIPVWTLLLSWITCSEQLPSLAKPRAWFKVIGIVLAAAGAMEVTLTNTKRNIQDDSADSNMSFGGLFFIANSLCMAIFLLMQKIFIFDSKNSEWKNYPFNVMAYSFLFAAVFLSTLCCYYPLSGQINLLFISRKTALGLLFVVLFTSTTAYLILSWSNMILTPTFVSAFWPVQILITAMCSYLVFGEQMAPLQYIGAGMVISGLFSVLYARREESAGPQVQPLSNTD